MRERGDLLTVVFRSSSLKWSGQGPKDTMSQLIQNSKRFPLRRHDSHEFLEFDLILRR